MKRPPSIKTSLRDHWTRAQVRHLLMSGHTPGEIDAIKPLDLKMLSQHELIALTEILLDERKRFQARMIDKTAVAEIAGMTVSWLDNSQSEKATELRALGVRYGTSHNSPVRFPLNEVLDTCLDPARN